jgi:hypothetical protein
MQNTQTILPHTSNTQRHSYLPLSPSPNLHQSRLPLLASTHPNHNFPSLPPSLPFRPWLDKEVILLARSAGTLACASTCSRTERDERCPGHGAPRRGTWQFHIMSLPGEDEEPAEAPRRLTEDFEYSMGQNGVGWLARVSSEDRSRVVLGCGIGWVEPEGKTPSTRASKYRQPLLNRIAWLIATSRRVAHSRPAHRPPASRASLRP